MAKNALMGLVLIFIVAACSQETADAPQREAQVGAELINESFDEVGNWTVSDTDNLTLAVEDGVYKITLGWRDRYLTGTNEVVHDSAVLEADVQLNASDRLTRAGIICRSSPQSTGDGYYFLISARGEYSIRKGTSDSTDQLVPLTTHAAIKTDGTMNRLRAVCIGNTLQFFVNDVFLDEVTDSTYNRGYAGLVVGLPPNASGSVTVTFDNLQVWEAVFP